MSKKDFMLLNLQLFGEGGDGGSVGAQGVNAADAGQTTTMGVKNPLANVKYGIQDGVQTTDAQGVSRVAEQNDRNAKFEELIKGEYKDLYDARVQDTIQKRLKSSKETIDRYNALSPVMETLARKYGVDASDPTALVKAIEDDDSYYEDEALEKGLSVEQLKAIKKMERENADLKRAMEEQRRQENAERIYADWIDQANKAKATYPSLDLKTELANPQFTSLLKAGVDVASAYTVVHKDEIIPAAMQYTAQTVQQKLTNKIISGGGRPSESAISSQSSVLVKPDVSMLNKADRAEIIRRVANGEKIRF